MSRRSLRFRLLIAAAVTISAALILAALGLVALFERHVERRVDAELDTYLNQMIAHLELTPDGRIRMTETLADPRFAQPLSGLYWQIQDDERPTLLRSRSLWDAVIELPQDRLELGKVHQHRLRGPAGRPLLVRERQILFHPQGAARRLRIAVAMERRELRAARDAFAADMLPYLAVMALVLILAAWIQVRVGLAPLDAVRRGVVEIRTGRQRRLEGAYPDEVRPLIDEVNGLLEAQEQAIERARAWTADLAHGLKTPLMVLSADSQRLREQGNPGIADDLDQLAETMRRRVDRELIRARVRSGVRSGRVRTRLDEAVGRIVRTLRRAPAGGELEWAVEIPAGVFVAVPGDDLAELLGNLLENAAKWAKSRVRVSFHLDGDARIHVEDDGPGVDPERLQDLGQRGLRLDRQVQGSGLGLAIARDIAEAYRGELVFERAPEGGLAVEVRLPAAV